MSNDAQSRNAKVSIILPTYNRESFLPAAFASIQNQEHKDWELVVVDDGSTDGTSDLVQDLASKTSQKVVYQYQENAGAYAARNRGLELARGDYVAFYDSDDRWRPFHLRKCVSALDTQPGIDWIFAALTRINQETGIVVEENSFYSDDRSPLPFFDLSAKKIQELFVIEDPRLLEYTISADCPCWGLHKAVMRKCVFDGNPLRTEFSECEDQLFAMRVIARGHKFAYFDGIHLDYTVHDHNSSLANKDRNKTKSVEVLSRFLAGLEDFGNEFSLTTSERRALKRRLSDTSFWNLAYARLWMAGDYESAIPFFSRGLRYSPGSFAKWKTFLVCRMRLACQRWMATPNA